MFTKSKEGRQYSFSLELSSKDIMDQNIGEIATFFDRAQHREKYVNELTYTDNIDIPVRVFREGNHGLKAIVLFLKDQKNLTFVQISKILGRDQRTIWCAYNTAKKRQSKTLSISDKSEKTKKPSSKYSSDELSINSSVFKERKLSILETAATALLGKYSVNETAKLLGRNKMTIWTVKRRAELKGKTKEKKIEGLNEQI
jgi:hypothetical protein